MQGMALANLRTAQLCSVLRRRRPSAFFGIRPASEVAQLLSCDVVADSEEGMTHVKEAQKKNDQVGLGQFAYLFTASDWGDARPLVRFF